MRVMHLLRSPVGGLFRHVRDLAAAQADAGAEVGVVASDEAGDNATVDAFAQLRPLLSLGLHRLPIHRLPHPSDVKSVSTVKKLMRELAVDIAHGHGAKGGLLARFSGVTSVYTPHGGSLHYTWRNPAGAAFLAAEKALVQKTGGFIFVCDFEKRSFDRKIGLGGRPHAVVLNGLQDRDFETVELDWDATDLLFIGEMRDIKGVDILLKAIKETTHPVTATLVGEGPDHAKFTALAEELGLGGRVRFPGRLPFRDALRLGRCIVLPSRNEAFPYVVLESVAAERLIIASDVGGVKEVLTPEFLIPTGNVRALSDRINDVIGTPDFHYSRLRDIRLKAMKNLSVSRMAESSLRFYGTIRSAEKI